MAKKKVRRKKKVVGKKKFHQEENREMDLKALEDEHMENSEPEVYESISIDDINEENVFTTNEKDERVIDKEGTLDSWEEWWFVCYLKELKEAGVILDADKNTEPLDLSNPVRHSYTKMMKTKTKAMVQHLMNPHTYTHDFNIKWNHEWQNKIFSIINSGKQFGKTKPPFLTFSGKFTASMIEVKGGYTKTDELQRTNMKRSWLFDKRQMFVQMVKVPVIFEKTFTPKAYMDYMVYKRPNKNKGIKPGDSRLKYTPKTCEEYLALLNEDTSGQRSLL